MYKSSARGKLDCFAYSSTCINFVMDFHVHVHMHSFNVIFQIWNTGGGCHIAKVDGRGIGVRPMIFFKDNLRVASAQETAVLVCLKINVLCNRHVHTHWFIK